ncbi:MAG: hypothetical protein H6669_01465 [Ardenticatenaceae bacterium]|nr:hypothetical protein [Ardenticatenaceae bacterium]
MVDRTITRDVSKCKVGQVPPTRPGAMKTARSSTTARCHALAETISGITAADPNLRWRFRRRVMGFDAQVTDVSGFGNIGAARVPQQPRPAPGDC